MAISDQIIATAQQYGVDPPLALEVAQQESGLDQNATSSKGAIGIFQLEPATAAMLGVDPYDATQNIDGGVRYLKQLLGQFGGNIDAALAAYNWGPGNVSSAMAADPTGWLSSAPAETQNYVRSITSALGEWNAAPASPVAAISGAMPTISQMWNSIGPTGRIAAAITAGVIGLAVAAELIL